MTMEPQVEDVQEAGVTGAAGADPEFEELDMPPPQALKNATLKAHAAAVNQRRGFTHATVARCEHSIEISSLC
jgi:hypothetical protein